MIGEVTINGNDAFSYYGLNLSDGAISTLLTPSSQKENIKNESRLEHGSRYILTGGFTQEREITLEVHIIAEDKTDFFEKYAAFCEVLQGEMLVIKSIYSPYYYRLLYRSCNQFQEFHLQIAKFQLKCIEPNCNDRGTTPVEKSIFNM